MKIYKQLNKLSYRTQSEKTDGQYILPDNKRNTVWQAKMIDYVHNSRRNIIQKIDFNTLLPHAATANSELVPGNIINNNNSAVGFMKVGSGFGHSVVDLEHKNGANLENHVIELVVYDDDVNVTIEHHVYPGSGRDHFGTAHVGNKFGIQNATGQTLLNQATALQGTHSGITPYKLMKFNSDVATMNCATFAKLLAKRTALALPSGVRDPDYQPLRSIKAGSAFFGLKTPGHVAK